MNKRSWDGSSALHDAVIHGHVEVRYLDWNPARDSVRVTCTLQVWLALRFGLRFAERIIFVGIKILRLGLRF